MHEFRPLIERQAARFKLDPKLIEAMCQVESGMDPWAVRFEPRWRWWLKPWFFAKSVGITAKTEEVCQQMSWGLMQTMGTVARELGYKDPLPGLCDPNTSLYYGCKKLAQLRDKLGGDLVDAIQAYNAGRPGTLAGVEYARKVTSKWSALT